MADAVEGPWAREVQGGREGARQPRGKDERRRWRQRGIW